MLDGVETDALQGKLGGQPLAPGEDIRGCGGGRAALLREGEKLRFLYVYLLIDPLTFLHNLVFLLGFLLVSTTIDYCQY